MNARARLLQRRVLHPIRALHRAPRRHNSTPPNPPSQDHSRARLDRVSARLPSFLRPYAQRLRAAPLSHVTAFLVLHEATAVAPLLAVFGALHYGGVMPEGWAAWAGAREGAERFARYFARKGWIEEREGESAVRVAQGEGVAPEQALGGGVKVVVEAAVAWAVVKALLPVRIAVSVWATPWFARVAVLPVLRVFGRAKKGG